MFQKVVSDVKLFVEYVFVLSFCAKIEGESENRRYCKKSLKIQNMFFDVKFHVESESDLRIRQTFNKKKQ